MTDLIEQMQRLNQDLTSSIKLLRKNGDALAEAERDYQVAKAQNVLRMKDQGCTITEIGLSIKGQSEVAEKMFKRDVAQVMYDANKEHINVVKLQLRIIESQIEREWSNV